MRLQDFETSRLQDIATQNIDNMERALENLYIWKESRIVVNSIYKMLSTCKDWGFRDQIQRAAVSIMNNIAEGFDSGSDAKFINYLNISKGSCSEVRSMLYLCEDFGYCSAEEREGIQNAVKRITTGIVKLSGAIQNEENK